MLYNLNIKMFENQIILHHKNKQVNIKSVKNEYK